MTIHPTTMTKAKVAITVDETLLRKVDRLVKQGDYPNRSQAVEAALRAHLLDRRRANYLRESRKLDVKEEQALANERYTADVAWPPF